MKRMILTSILAGAAMIAQTGIVSAAPQDSTSKTQTKTTKKHKTPKKSSTKKQSSGSTSK